MRAGPCTLQHALAHEAGSTVMEAVSLARKRGHLQVTPLHVAIAMLSSPTGLLRAACLQSHSSPLQCKALELCFSVALNRLPATSSSGLLVKRRRNDNRPLPSLSNALVAAFKRAQAQQRRGSADSQNHVLLDVKVELEQLVISILDDPSVSRVMREAGFSSTQVKLNLKQEHDPNPEILEGGCDELTVVTQDISRKVRSDDVISIVDTMVARKNRSIVLVGEFLPTCEAAVRGLMDMVKEGEVPEILSSVLFINFQLSSFAHMAAEEVHHKVGELKNCNLNGGAVLYVGDLGWVSEYTSSYVERRADLCPSMESAIKELGKLVSCGGGFFEGKVDDNRNLWLISTATYTTYMRCRNGKPSLETLLDLHPLTVPAGSLNFSLNYHGEVQKHMKRKREIAIAPQNDHFTSNNHGCISHGLPPWLQLRIEENNENTEDQGFVPRKDLFRSKSSDLHEQIEMSLSSFGLSQDNPNSSPSSGTSETEYLPKFKQLSAESLKKLCTMLEREVPWQKEIIPVIASTILHCRSGIARRKERFALSRTKEDTWLFFQGDDSQGKEVVARELASAVFGTSKRLKSIETEGSRLETTLGYVERFVEAMRDDSHRVFLMKDIDHLDSISCKSIKNAILAGSIQRPNGEEVGIGDAIVILSCKNYGSSVCLDLNLCATDELQDWLPDDMGLLEIVDCNVVFKLDNEP